MPPLAARVALYGVETVPALGRLVELMLSGGTCAATLRVKLPLALWLGLEESLTRTPKLNCPAWVGVPLMTPAALKLSPEGSAPELIDQL